MSRAVSGVFGTSSATPSSYSTTRSQDSEADGASFGDALDRAQANGSGDADKASAAGSPDSKSAAAKTSKSTTSRKTAPRKTVSEADEAQSKAQKKVAGQTSQDLEPDLEQGGYEGAADEQHPDGDKQQKKTVSAVDSAPSDMPAAIVQLQGGAPLQPTDSAVAPSPKDPAPAAKAAKATTATAAKAKVASEKDGLSTDESADDGSAQAPEDSANGASSSSNPTASSSHSRPAKSRLAIQPKDADGAQADASQAAASGSARQAALAPVSGASTDTTTSSEIPAVGPAAPSSRTLRKGTDDGLFQTVPSSPASASAAASASAEDASDVDDTPSSAESQFADANHPKIVSGITGRLLPNGGAMQLRLDPPELGAMQIKVEMRDGVMTASFETSNDQATRLLSHSLGDLRSALEAQGVSVQKLQVTQSPKQQTSSGEGQKDNSQTPQDTASQHEQQRKEMVRRMWQKLMGGQDPVDLVA
jgi:flagellar hook-length control protein FliK